MNRYKLTYYNSGGYRTSAEIETEYELRRRGDSGIAVMEGERCLGDESFLEQLLLERLGWVEEVTVVRFEAIAR